MASQIGDSNLIDSWATTGPKENPSDTKTAIGWEVQEQPPAEYANFLQHQTDTKLNHVLLNGIPEWHADTPYVKGNFAKRTGVAYVALADNTTSQPPSANWVAVAPTAAKRSIELDNGALQLDGDVDTPGAGKYYGTDAQGNRGFMHFPATVGFETGDLKWRYGGGSLPGYVRLNGETIGSAASGATERAHADTQALFIHLWTEDPTLDVSGGRTTAAADFAANRRLTLPDAKARTLVAADGMGAANTSRITGKGVIGDAGGEDQHTLTVAELPAHAHDESRVQTTVYLTNGANQYATGGQRGNTANTGGNQPHNNMQPYLVAGTVYIKL